METLIAKESYPQKKDNLEIPKIVGDFFFTATVNLAAFLRVKGIKHDYVKEYKGSKLLAYKKTDELENAIQEYKADEFMQAFVAGIRIIKDEIRN